jgi:hypothetical protein
VTGDERKALSSRAGGEPAIDDYCDRLLGAAPPPPGGPAASPAGPPSAGPSVGKSKKSEKSKDSGRGVTPGR